MPDQPTGYPEGPLPPLHDLHSHPDDVHTDAPSWQRWPEVVHPASEKLHSPQTPLIHHLISAQARIRPAAVALQTAATKITYGDLDRWTTQLAHHLSRMELKPEETVALCFEETLDALIGMIGIAKAGASYLPVDPYLPEQEWVSRLEKAESKVVLTTARLAAELPELSIRQVCLDAAWSRIAQEPTTPLQKPGHPDQLACTVHFCGTRFLKTGLQMSHRSLAQMAQASQQAFGIKTSDRILQISPLASTFAPAEILPAWFSGATLITGLDLLSSLDAILASAQEHEATVIHLPGDAWLALFQRLQRGRLDLPKSLRLIVIADETLQPKHLSLWKQHVGARIALQTTYGTSTPSQDEGLDLDIRAYVLNDDLQPIGQNEIGELYIAGSGVGRCFCQQSALTAQFFLPDPIPSNPGGRMYRTGHRVRTLEGGSLEFVSHPHRPSLRGLRLNLGEGHAPYREPTSIEAVFLTPSSDIEAPENALLRRLQGQLGGCVQSTPPSYNRLSLDDFVTRLVNEHLVRLGVKQAIH